MQQNADHRTPVKIFISLVRYEDKRTTENGENFIILQQCITFLGNPEGGRMQHSASNTFFVEAECLDTSFPIARGSVFSLASKPLKVKLK